MKDNQKIIETLRDDEQYYGEFGKQFLSNSDIKNLIEDPANFKNSESTLAMLHGSYFHTLLLEPEKVADFNIVYASTRNTKVYKEARDISGEDFLLLDHEAEPLDELASKLTSNLDLYDMIYAPNNKFEEPGIKVIHGETWKAKADIITEINVIDLKTTGDINKFKRSAWDYNYDSQAWLYQQIFGKPMLFLVACKKTGQIKLFDCSEEFLARGEEKVMDAIIQYRKFYGPDKSEDVNNYFTKDTL